MSAKASADEESHLLGPGSRRVENTGSQHSNFRRYVDFLTGVIVACLGLWISNNTIVYNPNSSLDSMGAINRYDYFQPYKKKTTKKGLPSKYQKFQALGFQIYTGGAPAFIPNEANNSTKLVHNPECAGLNSYGKADDFDEDDVLNNRTHLATLWECYLGHPNPAHDIKKRMTIMTEAVEKAYEVADPDDKTLKLFVAPEFFWRGKDGAYVFLDESVPSTDRKERHDRYFKDVYGKGDEDCTEICHILKGLENLVANKKYKDWVFVFGTAIVSETLPNEDEWDFLFYNFAPVYKGYDPDETDHFGKRFLVPKRYVSNIDFLTPARQFNDSAAKELVDITNPKHFVEPKTQQTIQVGPEHSKSTVVHNPYELQRKFYDRDMWYEYKDELNSLGYTMIEYDWLIMDNVTFTIEVCLDHDVHTALNAYLADNVLGSPTLIPKSVEEWNDKKGKYTGGIKYVNIPRHQAQLSLVSSSGMTANPQSMALADSGTLVLQDGLSSREGSMSYESECEHYSWHFAGGSEHISRKAKLTNTETSFQYEIHPGWKQHGIFDDLEDDADISWKNDIRGVFTTARYEPKITAYEPKLLANV